MNFFSAKMFCLLTALAGIPAITPTIATAAPGHGEGHSGTIGATAQASEATRTVTVDLRDVAFEPNRIDIKAGETIRFVLKNSGSLLHEFNIGTAAMHAQHQKEMLKMLEMGMMTATSMNMEMDHSNMKGAPMKHDDPNSVLVEPGKTKELVWKFPEATKLEFACNIPGHYESGMVGEFKFRK